MIVVLGKNGLLGSCIDHWYDVVALSASECDIASLYDIESMLAHYKPEVVINAAGIVPNNDKLVSHGIAINAIAPQHLKYECDRYNARLIQISSNCVFDGITGGYTEYSIPRPTDRYSATKFLGEVTDYPHLTVRCSFVGLPDPNGRGLLGNVAQQVGRKQTIIGWDKVKWNGVTTIELARFLMERAVPYSLTGLTHVHSIDTVTKYDLLQYANNIFGWNTEIIRESEITQMPHVENRTLKSEFEVGIVRKPIEDQLQELQYEYVG